MKLTIIPVLLIGIFTTCSAQVESRKIDKGLAIKNITIIPMDKERSMHNQIILIKNGKIEKIGPVSTLKIPADFHVIDGTGLTVLPGLADMHMHLRRASYDSMLSYLKIGITTLREMNGRPFILHWRDSINKGLLTGPRLYVASPSIANFSSPKEGYPTPENSVQVNSLIKAHKNAGYDYIKVYSFVKDSIYNAILKYSAIHKIKVVGHVPIEVPLKKVIESGLVSIEHFTGFADCCMTEESKIQDAKDFRSIFHAVDLNNDSLVRYIRLVKKYNVWNVPTITFYDRVLPAPMVKKSWNDKSLREQGLKTRKKILYELHKQGALIMIGTDSDAGEDLSATVIYDEMKYMNEAGLSPYEVIETATVLPAKFLGVEKQRGKVIQGMDADLLIIKGNPLKELNTLKSVQFVIKSGKLIFDNHSN